MVIDVSASELDVDSNFTSVNHPRWCERCGEALEKDEQALCDLCEEDVAWELFGEHLRDIIDQGDFDYFDHIEEPEPYVDDERIGEIKSGVGKWKLQ